MKKGFLASLISTVLGLVVINYIMPSVHISDFMAAVILALVLSLVNCFIKPIIKFLSLPLNILTLGIFNFVINAIVLLIAFKLTNGVSIDGFGSALIASLLLSVLQSIFAKLL